jgi:hypothetical protein
MKDLKIRSNQNQNSVLVGSVMIIFNVCVHVDWLYVFLYFILVCRVYVFHLQFYYNVWYNLPFLITYLIIVISIKKRIPQPHMHAGSRNRGNQKPSIEGEQAMHAQKIKRQNDKQWSTKKTQKTEKHKPHQKHSWTKQMTISKIRRALIDFIGYIYTQNQKNYNNMLNYTSIL